MSLDVILILAFVAMIAGFIDAIAGGGGLITLPALLLAGVSPVSALATSKFQSSAATLSATISFARKGLIQWRKGVPIAIMAFLGSILGALCVSYLAQELLLALVPVLLILVALYFIFSPKLSHTDKKPLLPFFVFSFSIVPLIGFYDGIFGPGAGSFFMVALIGLMGINIMNAISYTKLANAASNIGALIVFWIQGAIIFPIAIAMAIGAFIGAQIGARFALKFGSSLIKPLLIVVSLSMALKLLLDKNSPVMAYMSTLF